MSDELVELLVARRNRIVAEYEQLEGTAPNTDEQHDLPF
jgi:hypothetical protein